MPLGICIFCTDTAVVVMLCHDAPVVETCRLPTGTIEAPGAVLFQALACASTAMGPFPELWMVICCVEEV